MNKHLVLLFAMAVVAAAQLPCPPSDPNCPWQGPVVERIYLFDPDCAIDVTYHWRICNGSLEVAIDETGLDTSTAAGCGGWDRLRIFWYNYSGLLDYIAQGVLTQFHEWGKYGAPSIPHCPEKLLTAHVYTASCGVWLSCTYIVSRALGCDRGYEGSDPHFSPPDTVRTWKWQQCGQTCCKREYELCIKYDSILNIVIRDLRLIRKTRMIECTGQGSYDRPCEDGC